MRWIAALLLFLYLVFVARLTLADASVGEPIFTLADSWATRLSGGRLQWSETEVLANIVLFVPVGFLLTLVLGRPWLAVVLCVAGSVFIELGQDYWFVTRVPSVADVQHNGLGGALGVLVAWPLTWWATYKQPMVAMR